MAHNRKYVPGGIGLIRGKLRKTAISMDQDYTESLVIKSGMLEEARFAWIGLMYRYGYKNETVKPWYGRIDKKDGELPIAVEIKMHVLEAADKVPLDHPPGPYMLLRQILFVAALDALIHVCQKYKLQGGELFGEARSYYHNIPEDPEEVAKLGPRGLLKDDAPETIELIPVDLPEPWCTSPYQKAPQ